MNYGTPRGPRRSSQVSVALRLIGAIALMVACIVLISASL